MAKLKEEMTKIMRDLSAKEQIQFLLDMHVVTGSADLDDEQLADVDSVVLDYFIPEKKNEEGETVLDRELQEERYRTLIDMYYENIGAIYDKLSQIEEPHSEKWMKDYAGLYIKEGRMQGVFRELQVNMGMEVDDSVEKSEILSKAFPQGKDIPSILYSIYTEKLEEGKNRLDPDRKAHLLRIQDIMEAVGSGRDMTPEEEQREKEIQQGEPQVDKERGVHAWNQNTHERLQTMEAMTKNFPVLNNLVKEADVRLTLNGKIKALDQTGKWGIFSNSREYDKMKNALLAADAYDIDCEKGNKEYDKETRRELMKAAYLATKEYIAKKGSPKRSTETGKQRYDIAKGVLKDIEDAFPEFKGLEPELSTGKEKKATTFEKLVKEEGLKAGRTSVSSENNRKTAAKDKAKGGMDI